MLPRSIKCFALVDVLDTFLTCLGPVGDWGPVALFFILGPICGYFGARQLNPVPKSTTGYVIPAKLL